MVNSELQDVLAADSADQSEPKILFVTASDCSLPIRAHPRSSAPNISSYHDLRFTIYSPHCL